MGNSCGANHIAPVRQWDGVVPVFGRESCPLEI